MSKPIDDMFRVLCRDGNRWILASRTKVFPTLSAAQTYQREVSANRESHILTVKQLRLAYELAGQCVCGACMCCDLWRDIRANDVNLRPLPEQMVRVPMGVPARVSAWRDKHRANHWAAHVDHPVADWQHEVSEDNTRLGYAEWVCHQIECEEDLL
jgi:hypothetical protein